MLGKLSQFFNFSLPCQPVSTYVRFLPPKLLLLCLFVCLLCLFIYLLFLFVFCLLCLCKFCKDSCSYPYSQIKKSWPTIVCVCARVYHISLYVYKDSKFTELFH